MTTDDRPRYRAVLPLYVPALLGAAVLLVLFVTGQREQQALLSERLEQIVQRHEQTAQRVAGSMAHDLGDARGSIERFARELERQLDRPDPHAAGAFDSLFERRTDGSYRSRRASLDPQRDAAAVLPKYLQPDAASREFFVRSVHYTSLFGQATVGKAFVNTWILPKQGGEVIFWPGEPGWLEQPAADFDYRATEWFMPTEPAQNPQRKSYWTALAFDPVPRIWMASVVAPLYWRGAWYGSVGHDMPLANLLLQTQQLRQQEGSRFVLLSGQDSIVASDQYGEEILRAKGQLRLGQLGDPAWAAAIQQARQQGLARQGFVRVTQADRVWFVARIEGADWVLVNSLPLGPIVRQIESSFTTLRNIALATLLIELVIATVILALAHRRGRKHFNDILKLHDDLAERESRYRTLVSNLPGIVYRCANDTDWTMHYISDAVEGLTGYPAAAFIGTGAISFNAVVHVDDRDLLWRQIQNALEARLPYRVEYRLQHKDGQIMWVMEQGQGCYDAKDQLVWLDGVILNINALHYAQEQLGRLNLELEQKVELRTRALREALGELESFGHAIAHDLRAPLRQASSYLEMVGEAMPDDDPSRQWLERSQRALERMNDMIQGLWSVARLGSAALNVSRFALSGLVDEIRAELNADMAAKISWQVGSLPELEADRILLREVLQNLFDNAMKYSARQTDPVVGIRDHSEANGQEWVIEVYDNGAGFDPSHADKLFVLFQRLHKSSEFPGTGIGLALCARIIALHGGRIWASSSPGQGASFFFALPKRQ
ncbi:sensor histidine kinase [Chitinimonas sp. JJ19]|uniref:sensor histidine kinase n=1 Tax=Chitinimonas sp. JJ19 TaxID=3109352 RepID=UPI00300349D3